MQEIRKKIRAIIDNFPCSEDSSVVIVCYLEKLGLRFVDRGLLDDDAELIGSPEYQQVSAELSALMAETRQSQD